MPPPRLPAAVRALLASRQHRNHHAIWHYVRNRWHAMPAAERAFYEGEGWRPPRLNPIQFPQDTVQAPARDPGSGLDFLYMHRRMIALVDQALAATGDPSYPNVEGWSPIPWNHADADWPMPPSYDPGSDWAKDPQLTLAFQAEVAATYQNDTWLAWRTLDEVGARIEDGIHNWMHVHWSAQPWYTGAPGQDEDDPRNDWLASTYTSHVNDAFWKLHGWIDDRIGQWERASGLQADFAGAWEGPVHGGHVHELEATGLTRTLTPNERVHSREVFRVAPAGRFRQMPNP